MKMNEKSELNLFICENFYLEFQKVVEEEGFDDVSVKPFGCMCENKKNKEKNRVMLGNNKDKHQTNIILSSRYCDINHAIPEEGTFILYQSDFCFNHLASEQCINEIVERKGYIIGLNWLVHWRERIETMGFDQETARRFFHEFASQLVFFDAELDPDAEKYLKEVSTFLEIPHLIVPLNLKFIAIFLKSIIFEWRLNQDNQKNKAAIKDIQSQCAEYAAILDLMGKIASFTNKHDTIEKVKEIFAMVLGAQSFKYWNNEYEDKDLPQEVKEFLLNNKKIYSLDKEQNKFYIKIKQNDQTHGVFEVSDFLFPEYIERYLNFAIEIGKICGLVLTNIEQYDKLIKSENELQHLSFHDGLTGLYNRTYINNFFNENKTENYLTIFMFDIDGLKYVNDNYGHLEGDKLISAASTILKQCFRETDIVARIGGDEFMAILPDCEVEMAGVFKTRLENMIKNHNESIQVKHLTLGVSSGFAVTEKRVETIDSLMQKADDLMYAEKREKKKEKS